MCNSVQEALADADRRARELFAQLDPMWPMLALMAVRISQDLARARELLGTERGE